MLVLKDGSFVRPPLLSKRVMWHGCWRRSGFPFPDKCRGQLLSDLWSLWVISRVQEGKLEHTYKRYLGRVPSFAMHAGFCYFKGNKVAFSSPIPEAGGSYSLTEGHSFMRVEEVVNTWMHDGNLSSLMKFGALLCQAAHEPERVVPAWMLCRRRGVRTLVQDPKWCLEGGSQAERLCDSIGMLVARSRTHKYLGSPLLCCGALLLPRSTLKQGKWINCFSWSSFFLHCQAVLLRWRFGNG